MFSFRHLLVGSFFLLAACSNEKKEKDEPDYSVNLQKSEDILISGFKTDKTKDLVYHIDHIPNLSIFSKCFKATGLQNELSTEGTFTLFIPDDSAFANMQAGAIDNLMKPAFQTSLKNIISYHILQTPLSYEALIPGEKLITLEGKTLSVTEVDNQIHINKTSLKIKDVYTSNGIIHIINRVLIPQKEFHLKK